MGFLDKKKILITGILSNHSIAYGIAKMCKTQGAELAITYADSRFKDRIYEFADELETNIVIHCNVSNDVNIKNMFLELSKKWNQLDSLVHSIAFAPKDAISGDFLNGINRDNFRITHEISSYSFCALTKFAIPMMKNNASILTLSYIGSEKCIPNYNMMGLAKASLEASVKYLACSLGPKGIRVNCISAGPVKTLASRGIKDFYKIFHNVEKYSPMRRNVTIEDIGNTATFILSDLAKGITGEIINVDSGFSITINY